ncbi:hypothetical protein CHS0354_005597 [Potamilus streckersoni]|uniref:Uncharacterized protein n=1 Tax=Potamilus streckersoni TaxID=2493646 RepID=A0AAE0SJC7_9BIVA|nr:hypothetical protein CHS0354_005597 [Potamilus streckersoni]
MSRFRMKGMAEENSSTGEKAVWRFTVIKVHDAKLGNLSEPVYQAWEQERTSLPSLGDRDKQYPKFRSNRESVGEIGNKGE